MLEHAGMDASEAFNDVGHSSDAKDMLKEYKIGVLISKKDNNLQKQQQQQQQPPSIVATEGAGAAAPAEDSPAALGSALTALRLDGDAAAAAPPAAAAAPAAPAPAPADNVAAPASSVTGWISSFFE